MFNDSITSFSKTGTCVIITPQLQLIISHKEKDASGHPSLNLIQILFDVQLVYPYIHL